MIANKKNNKAVTTLTPGEVIEERYNGSNAKFAIFKTKNLTAGTTVSFSELKDFKYIDWGDGSPVTLGNGTDIASHEYDTAKEFVIVVYGIDNFGAGSSSPGKNIFGADIVTEVYFGEGVNIWSDDDSIKAFVGATGATTLEKVKNLSNIPANAFQNQTALSVVTFNPDCREIGANAFNNTCTATGLGEKCIVIPKHITTIANNAFSDSGFRACIEYTGIGTDLKPTGYSGTNYYYYSEATKTSGSNYWHYVNGVPTLW